MSFAKVNQNFTAKMLPNPLKYNFSGKVALITGITSSTGIGSAIASQFARYGASVAITGNNAQNLKILSQKIQQFSPNKPLEIVGDLRDEHFCAKLLQQTVLNFGQLNFLVNNCAGETNGTNLKELNEAYKSNLKSVVQLTQLAAPYLEKTRGYVLNVSSLDESLQSNGISVYNSFKEALDILTKAWALELGSKGIQVNSINIGSQGLDTKAPIIDQFYDQSIADQSEQIRTSSDNDEEDIVQLDSVLINSNDSRKVTGSIVNYDQLMYIHKW